MGLGAKEHHLWGSKLLHNLWSMAALWPWGVRADLPPQPLLEGLCEPDPRPPPRPDDLLSGPAFGLTLHATVDTSL